MSVFNCNLCNKNFKTKFSLNRHLSNKIPCNTPKEELKCDVCDLKLRSNYDKKRHEKSAKHITNITNIFNGDVHNGHNFNNIVNLTLVTNPFEFTNLGCIDSKTIEIIHIDFVKTLNRNKHDKFILNFRSIIYLLEKIHFDLRDNRNQNLRILLMFPNLEKKVVEYMILEINPNTKAITWNRIEYHELLDKLIQLLEKLHELNEFTEFIDYIEYMKSELYLDCNKEKIELMLIELYKKYNNKQNKLRETDDDLIKNINLYKEYRNQELLLPNGYIPPINNPMI